jgi:hypothetical protein
MSETNDPTTSSTGNGVSPLSSSFLEFCAKVRRNDPSILPEPSKPFKIDHMSEREGLELVDALLENTNVKNLGLWSAEYTKSYAGAMAKYVRTSKHLQSLRWERGSLQKCEDIICCLLHAIQESASLKELHIQLPPGDGPSNLAFENMLTHTLSLRSLSLVYYDGALAGARSGLEKNSTLRELTLDSSGAISPILTSLCDHPHLRKICLLGRSFDPSELETLLRSHRTRHRY